MTLRTICVGIMAAFLISSASAQQCYTYSSDLAEYDDASSDGSTIYTSVLIDGSQEMDAWGQCQYFLGSVQHTAHAFNQLSTGGQTVGGWASDSGVCASCYVFFSNDQSVAPSEGDDVSLETQVYEDCNFGGTFFETYFGFIDLKLAYTKVKWTGAYDPQFDGSALCYVNSWCTPNTTPPACNPGAVTQKPVMVGATASCESYYNTNWLAERIGSEPWNCIPIFPGQNAGYTPDPSLASCTPQ